MGRIVGILVPEGFGFVCAVNARKRLRRSKLKAIDSNVHAAKFDWLMTTTALLLIELMNESR
jgi:hypothetical protein